MTMSLEEIDVRLDELCGWIERAGQALLTFYSDEQGGFRRSTLSENETSATSTTRSLFAAAEFRRFCVEEKLKLDRIDEVLIGTINRWLVPVPEHLEEIRARSDNERNHFTDAHLLMAIALAPALAALTDNRSLARVVRHVQKAGADLAIRLTQHVRKFGGAKIHDDDPETHDFITLHAIRGIDALRRSSGRAIPDVAGLLASRVESDVLRQLGYHSADVYANFDPAQLLFSAALLPRVGVSNWAQLTRRAIDVVGDSQTDDGAWPVSRVIAYEKKGLLHVASYELGLTLTFILARDLELEAALAEPLLTAIERTFRLVQGEFIASVPRTKYRGWANDRTRWPGLVESWATAIVVSFLMRYRDLLIRYRQRIILTRYRGRPIVGQRSSEWPDLELTLRVPRPLPPGALADLSDPSPNQELADRLGRQFLSPIVNSADERPKKASLILYGKPGTRKTSLVKQLAAALRWPMLTLSPPHFLSDGGLDGFEASADRIFRDLMRLRRAVVLFDECEDFFKPRSAGAPAESGDSVDDGAAKTTAPAPPESRTLGAFITAGMLPRLQDLRDSSWVIFVLATNSRLEDLDPAVTRPGRFDAAQEIKDPGLSAQLRYLQSYRTPISEKHEKLLSTALTELDTEVPFRAIDETVGLLRAKSIRANRASVAKALRNARERKRPPSLY